jgi:uncharacterized SAM-binding protein YcdF (DUF218 family)
MRRLLWAVPAAVVTAWLASFTAVAAASRRDRAAPADAIVVLGAAQYNGVPSPVFRARLDHAAALWRRGLAPFVLVAGGTGAGDTVSEAEAGRRYLLRVRGLPDSAVTPVGSGNATEPSLRAVARQLPGDGRRRAILVSDGFHQLRLHIIARRLGLEALGSPAPASPISRNRRRELGYLLAESLKAPVAFLVTRSE